MATIKHAEIKRLRKAKGLTQEELAEKCCVTQSYINKVERGKTIPTITFLFELGKVLKIDYKTLLQ
jgi:transcriptional regulator with XRE-family HTH domain